MLFFSCSYWALRQSFPVAGPTYRSVVLPLLRQETGIQGQAFLWKLESVLLLYTDDKGPHKGLSKPGTHSVPARFFPLEEGDSCVQHLLCLREQHSLCSSAPQHTPALRVCAGTCWNFMFTLVYCGRNHRPAVWNFFRMIFIGRTTKKCTVQS